MVSALQPPPEPLWARTTAGVLVGGVVAAACGYLMMFPLYALSLTAPGAAVLGPAADYPPAGDRPFLFALGGFGGAAALLLCLGAIGLLIRVMRLSSRRASSIVLVELVLGTAVIGWH